METLLAWFPVFVWCGIKGKAYRYLHAKIRHRCYAMHTQAVHCASMPSPTFFIDPLNLVVSCLIPKPL